MSDDSFENTPATPRADDTGLERLAQNLQYDRENIPVAAEGPKPEIPPPDIQKELHQNDEVKALRTYASDIQEAVKHQNESIISIKVKEQEKKRSENTVSDSARRSAMWTAFTFISLFLMVAGLVVVGVFWYQSSVNAPKPIPTDTTIIVSNDTLIFETQRTSSFDIGTRIAAETIAPGTKDAVTHIDLHTDGGRSLSPAEFLIFVNSQAPAQFTRSLEEEYMVGIYDSTDGRRPFLILKTNDYNIGFAGMLEWEKKMPGALLPLFTGTHYDGEAVFVDRIVRNRDTRKLSEGGLIYSFLDQHTIAITTSEEALADILNRYITSKSFK